MILDLPFFLPNINVPYFAVQPQLPVILTKQGFPLEHQAYNEGAEVNINCTSVAGKW